MGAGESLERNARSLGNQSDSGGRVDSEDLETSRGRAGGKRLILEAIDALAIESWDDLEGVKEGIWRRGRNAREGISQSAIGSDIDLLASRDLDIL